VAYTQDVLAIMNYLHLHPANTAAQKTADVLLTMVLGVLECWSVGVLHKILSSEGFFRRSITPVLQYSSTPVLHDCGLLVPTP
jgi:hypothetical protein